MYKTRVFGTGRSTCEVGRGRGSAGGRVTLHTALSLELFRHYRT